LELLEVSIENVITIGLIVFLTLVVWSLVASWFAGGEVEPEEAVEGESAG